MKDPWRGVAQEACMSVESWYRISTSSCQPDKNVRLRDFNRDRYSKPTWRTASLTDQTPHAAYYAVYREDSWGCSLLARASRQPEKHRRTRETHARGAAGQHSQRRAPAPPN